MFLSSKATLADIVEQLQEKEASGPTPASEDMQGWLRALAASSQEHAELARWHQGLLTTSSTDEGLPRREPERPRRK
ncbi:hypothetical protein TURU_036379 [Turdus rufiventris]|nr:hypothetical protein TURU_036379 [Turdus rufiventris]